MFSGTSTEQSFVTTLDSCCENVSNSRPHMFEVYEILYPECRAMKVGPPKSLDFKFDGITNIEKPMWALHCGPLREIEKSKIDRGSSFGLVWDVHTSPHPGIHNIVGVKCEPLKNHSDLPFRVTLLGYTRLTPQKVQEAATLILRRFGCHHMIFRYHHQVRELWLSSILHESCGQPSIISPGQFISLAYETVYCCDGERIERFCWPREGWISGVVGELRTTGFCETSCVESAWGLEQGIQHKDLRSEDEAIQSLATASLTETLNNFKNWWPSFYKPQRSRLGCCSIL